MVTDFFWLGKRGVLMGTPVPSTTSAGTTGESLKPHQMITENHIRKTSSISISQWRRQKVL